MINLENRITLVTGGARGIGASISEMFLKLGAKVVVSGSNEENLKAFVDGKNNAAYVRADLSNDDEVNNLYAKATECFGEIDVLVNNAGITKDKLIIMMKDEDFDSVINVNLRAPFKLCKAATKAMMKKNYGRIINISSVVGFSGNPGQTNYVASKAGIVGFSKSLAYEVAGRGITVNCVAPGFIESDMTCKLNEKQTEHILANIPQKRMGKGDDIAAMCAFLASDSASYITGQTMHINGGMLMV